MSNIIVVAEYHASGNYARFDLQVQSMTVLATITINNVLAGYSNMKVSAGTIAYIIETGELFTLGFDGAWYNADGSGEA